MFGPIDESKPFTTLVVHSPVQIMSLRRAVLDVGTYRIQGDLRPKLGNIREKRKIQAGIFEVQFSPGAPAEESVSAQTQSQPTMPKAPMDVDIIEPETPEHTPKAVEPESIVEQSVPVRVEPTAPESDPEPVVADAPAGKIGVVDIPEVVKEPELPQADPSQSDYVKPAVEEKEPEPPKKLRSNAKLSKLLEKRGEVISGGVSFTVTDESVIFTDQQGVEQTRELSSLSEVLDSRIDEWYATFEEQSDEEVGKMDIDIDQDIVKAGAEVAEPPPPPARGRFGMPVLNEGRIRRRKRS